MDGGVVLPTYIKDVRTGAPCFGPSWHGIGPSSSYVEDTKMLERRLL